MKYLGAKGDEKNTSYQVYGSVRVKEIQVVTRDAEYIFEISQTK